MDIFHAHRDTRLQGVTELGSALDDCELITVAYRSRRPLQGLLSSLPAEIPLIVVDNSAEVDDLADLVASRPNSRYVDSGGNLGFGVACNIGANLSERPYLIFLNPDCRPTASDLEALARQLASDSTIGACGPALIDDDGKVHRGGGGWQPTVLRSIVHASGADRLFRHAGIWISSPPNEIFQAQWLAGTCLVIRRELFLEIGGFDSRYFLYQEDMDLGRRLCDSGSRQLFCGNIRVKHVGGGSSPAEYLARLWALRGRALSNYLVANNPPVVALLIRTILSLGFVARTLIFLTRRDRERAREMWTYSRMLHASQTTSTGMR